MPNPVTETAAATCSDALAHFGALLQFETDCWDVHAALSADADDFVLIDVRGSDAYAKGHVSGAVSLFHGKITASRLRAFGADRVFVVYCAGPHCNGADKAARRIAELGFPVKKMIGGVTGWIDEGFDLVPGEPS
jgi:rhodanese-related sulfurtransferase